ERRLDEPHAALLPPAGVAHVTLRAGRGVDAAELAKVGEEQPDRGLQPGARLGPRAGDGAAFLGSGLPGGGHRRELGGGIVSGPARSAEILWWGQITSGWKL